MTKRIQRPHRKPGRKAGNAKRKGRTAPGPLTPTGGNHREATEATRRAERQRRAWNMYVYQRLSMREIAEILTADGLQCTAKTVAQDIHYMYNEVRAERSATVSAAPEVEEARLNELDQVLRPLAMGQLSDMRTTGRGRKKTTVRVPLKTEASARIRMEAIGQLRRNGESRRKLLGIDKQPDDGVIPVEQVVAMVRALVGDVLAITAALPEVRKALAESMRRRFGVIEGEVVSSDAAEVEA